MVHLPGYWSVGRAFVSGGRDPSVACVSGCGYCNLLAGHPPSTAFVQGHGSLAIWHCVWRWFCQQAPGRYPGSTGVPNEDTGARLRDRFSSLQSAYGWSPSMDPSVGYRWVASTDIHSVLSSCHARYLFTSYSNACLCCGPCPIVPTFMAVHLLWLCTWHVQ